MQQKWVRAGAGLGSPAGVGVENVHELRVPSVPAVRWHPGCSSSTNPLAGLWVGVGMLAMLLSANLVFNQEEKRKKKKKSLNNK